MIVDDILATERRRFDAKGYDVVVTPVSISVSRRLLTRSLANDCYVLTGICGSDDDARDGNMEVAIASPSNSLQASVRQLSMLGSGVNRTFRRSISIRTLGEASIGMRDGIIDGGEQQVPRYRIEFIKVTPVKRITKQAPQ